MFHHILSLLLAVTVVLSQKNVPDGPRGGIELCEGGGGGFFSNSEKCFKVKLAKLSVQMGSDGTDDDVRVKVCSDEPTKTNASCCTTPALKRTFHDDWSSGDLEVWEKDKLGSCAKTLFKVRKQLEVTLLKDGTDSLNISSIIIDTEGKTVDNFKCGKINVTAPTSKTAFCGVLLNPALSYEKIKKIDVTMGNTGTDNDVRVDICSDVDNTCCKTQLSSTIPLIDDWSRNDNEVWDQSYWGKCRDMVYKVKNTLKVSIETKKVAKSGLVVNKLLVKTESLRSKSSTYDCGGYTMTGKERQEKICRRETNTTTTTTTGKKGVASLVSQVGNLANQTATRPVFKD